MTSIPRTPTQSQLADPLRLLASVSCGCHDRATTPHAMSPSSDLSAGSLSPSSSVRSVSSAPTSTDMNDVASPRTSRTKSPEYTHETRHRSMRSTSSRYSASASTSFVSPPKSSRRSRKSTDSHVQAKMQTRKKRDELKAKAIKIKSLDNSPVNERQLLVLRMVYDEITMYPSESWMVLLAIVINRAYKQVKNWFSNERQKNREGSSVPVETTDGDKIKIRHSAHALCQEWSDSFLEEVVMIYNYRIQRNSRFRALVRAPEDPSAART